MSLFIIDIEADGPIPHKYSMLSIGAIKVMEDLNTSPTFYSTLKPMSKEWNEESIKVCGFTREETLHFENPQIVMKKFYDWVIENNKNGRPIFISDNNGFDFAWINWYFHYFIGENPFGWSSRRIGDFYSGITKDFYATWKQLRKTKHTHNALDDAFANATAFLEIMRLHDIKISLK